MTEIENRQIIAAVVKFVLKVLFKNFTYKFGGKTYHQKDGGPIGVQALGAASNLVMEDWALDYRNILERSEL